MSDPFFPFFPPDPFSRHVGFRFALSDLQIPPNADSHPVGRLEPKGESRRTGPDYREPSPRRISLRSIRPTNHAKPRLAGRRSARAKGESRRTGPYNREPSPRRISLRSIRPTNHAKPRLAARRSARAAGESRQIRPYNHEAFPRRISLRSIRPTNPAERRRAVRCHSCLIRFDAPDDRMRSRHRATGAQAAASAPAGSGARTIMKPPSAMRIEMMGTL